MASINENKDEYSQVVAFPDIGDKELMEQLKNIENDTETSIKIFMHIEGENPSKIENARKLVSEIKNYDKVNSVDMRETQKNLDIKIKEEFQIGVQDIKNDLQNQISQCKDDTVLMPETAQKHFQEMVHVLKEEFRNGIKEIKNDIQNKISEDLQKKVINMGHALKLDIEINAAKLKQSFEKMGKNVNFDHKIMSEMVHKQLGFGIRAFQDKQEALQIDIKELKHNLANRINSNKQKIKSLEDKLIGNMDFMDLIPDVDLDQFYKSSEYKKCNKTSGQQQLHTACRLGRVDVVHKLINIGIRTYIKDKRGFTPLHYASTFGHLNAVKYLIHVGAPIDLQTNDGDTALMQASQKGHKSIVEYLCFKKAKVNIKNKNNSTALSVACGKDKNKIIEILKKHGA